MCVKTIKKNEEKFLCKNSRKLYFIICYKNLVGFDFTLPQFIRSTFRRGSCLF